jgi:hypothetical protein
MSVWKVKKRAIDKLLDRIEYTHNAKDLAQIAQVMHAITLDQEGRTPDQDPANNTYFQTLINQVNLVIQSKEDDTRN